MIYGLASLAHPKRIFSADFSALQRNHFLIFHIFFFPTLSSYYFSTLPGYRLCIMSSPYLSSR